MPTKWQSESVTLITIHLHECIDRHFYLKLIMLNSRYAFCFQCMHSLGIKPITLALLVPCFTVCAKEMRESYIKSFCTLQNKRI